MALVRQGTTRRSPLLDGASPPVPHNAGDRAEYHPRGSNRGSGPVLAWERRYRALVITGDVVAVTGVAALAALAGFTGVIGVFDPLFALAAALVVACCLPVRRAWTLRVLGEGAEEFRRLGAGFFTAAVVLALVGPLIEPVEAWPWVFLVIPVMSVVALILRYALRRWLHRGRRDGQCMLPVVAAGGLETVRDFIERAREQPHVGWRVEAACIVTSVGNQLEIGEIDGVPVVGGLDQLADHVRRAGYRVVAVTPDPYWTPRRLQELAWDLEGTSAELTVAPVLMEVGGPRLDVSGVLGMPMLRVAPPAFTGGRRLVKEVIDRVGAALLIVLAAPLLAAVAAAVKFGDGGAVFYSQRRVKRDGEAFRMWKFRTMIEGSDTLRDELSDAHDGDGPLFKLRADPRVTRVGVVLRRFSIDELPQLFNVLSGSMSLVGPRPPLPEEIRSYGPDVGRRLLVKPGMTGLWQVSGRSDLSWKESVRLDLQYVEDWSLALDATVLWKTARAVVFGRGAY